jgi:hypothetical protein
MKPKRNFNAESLNQLKSEGVKVSRKVMAEGGKRYYQMNESAIQEGAREIRVLNMKRFYNKRGWSFPPKSHPIATTVHLINGYYGKDVVKHTPKDSLEKKLGV